MKIELIEWEDSIGSPAGWEIWDPKEPEPATILTVGRVIRESERSVTVCPTGYLDKNGDLHAMGTITIPKCSITHRQMIYQRDEPTSMVPMDPQEMEWFYECLKKGEAVQLPNGGGWSVPVRPKA